MAPRLVDDAAWGENVDADEFMLQPGGIDAIAEFWRTSGRQASFSPQPRPW